MQACELYDARVGRYPTGIHAVYPAPPTGSGSGRKEQGRVVAAGGDKSEGNRGRDTHASLRSYVRCACAAVAPP